jgi:hypothetical protein
LIQTPSVQGSQQNQELTALLRRNSIWHAECISKEQLGRKEKSRRAEFKNEYEKEITDQEPGCREESALGHSQRFYR